jgi:CPA2 family monovalent cation:H+ antiporter-2
MGQVGEFSFIIAAAFVAAGGSDRLYSIAIAVAVLTSFTTPWLIRASEPIALAVDARLPRPLQTFVALYGSWIELLRQRRAGSPWQPIRRGVGLLFADAAMLCGVVIAAAQLRPGILQWIGETTGIAGREARWLVVALGAAAATPFIVGGVQVAGRLSRLLAERALPRPAQGKVDNALAPRRALTGAIQLGVVLLTGLVVAAVTQPFVPSIGGPIVILGVIAVLGYAFWRSAKDLLGHVQAGAEVAIHALTSKSHRAEGTERALQRVEALLPGIGTLSPAIVESGSRAAGHTLAELHLRGLTGATIVAIVRGGEPIINPSGHEHLYAADVLALSGSHEAVDAARTLLAEPAPIPAPSTYTTMPHSDTAASAQRAP